MKRGTASSASPSKKREEGIGPGDRSRQRRGFIELKEDPHYISHSEADAKKAEALAVEREKKMGGCHSRTCGKKTRRGREQKRAARSAKKEEKITPDRKKIRSRSVKGEGRLEVVREKKEGNKTSAREGPLYE